MSDDTPDAAQASAPSSPRKISRRSLLIAGSAVVAVAVAVPVGIALWPRSPVERMLGSAPFAVAHRGGSADWPEMSAYAYSRSAAAGVAGLEMSVGRTSDGVWCGVHDKTLDRTSGTSGFVVAEHTWAEVESHRIDPPSGQPDQPSRPYWRLTDLIDRYNSTHALWIDPKAVDPDHYGELISTMSGRVSSLADVFVAKSDATNLRWAELARQHGMQSWGFYYGRDLDADPGLFARTQKPWTMLGLDWRASAAHWSSFVADGRPVVAHVISTRTGKQTALRRGAKGLMVSGITEVIG